MEKQTKNVIENAYKIDAKLVRETEKSYLLDCEGDVEWFPKSKCNYDQETETLEAPLWLLQEKFPETKF